MKSRFEEERAAKLREKYNVPDGKLKFEQGRSFPKLTQDKPSDRHYQSYINGLRQKFNMEGLELEGQEAFQPKEDTSFFDKSEKAEVKDLKLCVGSTSFNGKRLNIFYLRTKP